MAGELTLTVIGNLVADPELRFTPNGAAVANFTVAQSARNYDRETGGWKDGDTVFMRCNVWRHVAENVAESLTKGSRVIVTGRLKQRSYEKDGQTRSIMELEVDDIGASMKGATVKINKAKRDGGSETGGNRRAPAEDPWSSAGGNGGNRQAAGGNGGNRQAAGDPWGASSEEPPF